jgi:tetratricopeptide (TPR) repeat protein
VFGPEHPSTAAVHVTLADYLAEMHDPRSLAHGERARAIYERAHLEGLEAGGLYSALSSGYTNAGRHEDALRALRRDQQLEERIRGTDAISVAWSMEQQAGSLARLARYDEAVRVARAARAIAVARAGEDSIEVAAADEALGSALLDAGSNAEAAAVLERAVRWLIANPPLASEMTDVIPTLTALGDALMRLGRPRDALARYDQALELAEHAPMVSGTEMIDPLVAKAELLLGRGRAGEALPLAERAVAAIGDHVIEPETTAAARFALSRALWDSGGDRSRALAIAREAIADYARASAGAAKDRARASAWLTAHRAGAAG